MDDYHVASWAGSDELGWSVFLTIGLGDYVVKILDDREIFCIDHVGVALWRAATAWKERLHSEMVRRGHAWYGDARGVIAIHLDSRGLPQSELVARTGLSKQAVQQLLDGLEQDGIIERIASVKDRRSKRVVYTAQGRASVRDALAVKQQIEEEYRARLGDRTFNALRTALRKLGQ
jgi:DNA-binding MarR family transcriptional regulator